MPYRSRTIDGNARFGAASLTGSTFREGARTHCNNAPRSDTKRLHSTRSFTIIMPIRNGEHTCDNLPHPIAQQRPAFWAQSLRRCVAAFEPLCNPHHLAMLKRLVAAIGVFAFALAYLPTAAGWCAAAETISCCAGKMCPMHRHSTSTHSDCGMAATSDLAGTGHSSAPTMCSCPGQREVRYVGALVYVLAAPPRQVLSSRVATLPLLPAVTVAAPFAEIIPPPPRSIPA